MDILNVNPSIKLDLLNFDEIAVFYEMQELDVPTAKEATYDNRYKIKAHFVSAHHKQN